MKAPRPSRRKLRFASVDMDMSKVLTVNPMREFRAMLNGYWITGRGGIDARGRAWHAPTYLRIPPADYARHWELEGPR